MPRSAGRGWGRGARYGLAFRVVAGGPSIRSGLSVGRRVSPLWPVWPPLFLPDRPRRLLDTRGGFLRPSLEGGLLLLELFLSSWRRSSATCCLSAAFAWHKAVFCSRRTSTACRSVSTSALRAGVSSTSVLTHGAASSASPNLRPSNDFLSLAASATQRGRREGVLGSYKLASENFDYVI